MSHRTQITLTDEQYADLLEESRLTGVGLGELVRRAIDRRYRRREKADMLRALEASFGSWKDRSFDGASYVEGRRRGMARRLARE